jgi:diguanylate cyclase (GGDEF)-like protein
VPNIAVAHFVIDLPTLFAVTVFLTATGGLLLLFSWLQNRSTRALAWWGMGYVLGALASALLASSGAVPSAIAVPAANALICATYGSMWAGARSFEGRRVRLVWVLAGPAICAAAFAFDGFAQSAYARVGLVSAISAVYALFSAGELWFARDRELISRWPTLGLVVGHAGFLLARIPLAPALVEAVAAGHAHTTAASVMAFEILFVTFCLPFLRVAMSKERTELEQRRAAMTDALTGIANRRAFFDRGAPLLAWTLADRRSAALLLFDLDRFKEINDTAGHQAGDEVLRGFCALVAASMRPGDLFARLGGEEFACLLPDTTTTQALQAAERVRREFAATRLPALDLNPTVSVGVAMANEAGRTLSVLLATADRALYRAKAEGRNRVAHVPLILVDGGGETARRAERLAVVAAPASA